MAIEERPTVRSTDGKQFEIKLTPDWRLNVAYSPNFTLGDEIHDSFLEDIASQAEQGGRARCWRCDAIAVKFTLIHTALGLFALSECGNCQTWGLY